MAWNLFGKTAADVAEGGTKGIFSGLGEFGETVKEIITGEASVDKKLEQMGKIIAWGQQEARHKSIFIAGWRPYIGWVCGAGLTFNIIIHPIFLWLNVIFQWNVSNPPVLDRVLMAEILFGMLGMAGVRSFDKYSGKG